MEIQYLGNMDLLKQPKTAFLAASTIPPDMVLKCYDWAVRMAKEGQCVISGFSSHLEKEVLHFLMKGHQPIILVLARQMYKQIPAELQSAQNPTRMEMRRTGGPNQTEWLMKSYRKDSLSCTTALRLFRMIRHCLPMVREHWTRT